MKSKYLGVIFSKTRSFYKAVKHNVEHAKKSLHLPYKRINNLHIPIDLQLQLLDHTILERVPIDQHIKSRIVGHWISLVNGTNQNLLHCKRVYNIIHNDYSNSGIHYKWMNCILTFLTNLSLIIHMLLSCKYLKHCMTSLYKTGIQRQTHQHKVEVIIYLNRTGVFLMLFPRYFILSTNDYIQNRQSQVAYWNWSLGKYKLPG